MSDATTTTANMTAQGDWAGSPQRDCRAATADPPADRVPLGVASSMIKFEVQGRLLGRDRHRVVRDEVRLADTGDRDEAVRIAGDLVRDGFTVWIWQRAPGSKGADGLTLIERLEPADAGRRRGKARA